MVKCLMIGQEHGMLQEYSKLDTNAEQLKYLKDTFSLHDEEKAPILLDLYWYTLGRHAKRLQLGPEQTSAFFSIVKTIHENCVASPLVNFDKDYGHFKDLVLSHSIHRPPFSQQIFSFQEMKAITQYFRHYLLYKHVFTKKVRMEFVIENYMDAEESLDKQVDDMPSVQIDTDQSDKRLGDDLNSEMSPLSPKIEIHLAPLPEPKKEDKIEPKKEEPKPEEPVVDEMTLKREAAKQELKNLIMSTLATKMDELKTTFTQRLTVQEDAIASKLKKLDGTVEDDKKKTQKKK